MTLLRTSVSPSQTSSRIRKRRDDLARVRGQQVQDVELPGGERDRRRRPAGPGGPRVHDQVADLHHLAPRRTPCAGAGRGAGRAARRGRTAWAGSRRRPRPGPSTRSRTAPRAVSRSTGVATPDPRNRRHTSIPSRPGSIQSRTSTSYGTPPGRASGVRRGRRARRRRPTRPRSATARGGPPAAGRPRRAARACVHCAPVVVTGAAPRPHQSGRRQVVDRTVVA